MQSLKRTDDHYKFHIIKNSFNCKKKPLYMLFSIGQGRVKKKMTSVGFGIYIILLPV